MIKRNFNNYSKKYNHKIRSDINITPFVDVMLVLLIIFMLTSHMITSGVDLDLPKSSEKFAEKKEYINISIDKKFVIYLQDNIVKERDLVKKIQALVKEKPKVHILLYGDKDVSYGKIIHIFSLLKQASINNLTLVTEEY